MQLSRATQYAILAMAQLKTDGEPIPCSQLASLSDMPDRYLLQVLRSLVNAGLLKSTRGVDGGYRLAKTAAEISLQEIIVAIDGPITVGDLSVLAPLTKKSQALVRDSIQSGEQDRKLHQTKLAHILLT